jgi:hypothetical protein
MIAIPIQQTFNQWRCRIYHEAYVHGIRINWLKVDKRWLREAYQAGMSPYEALKGLTWDR